MEQQISAKIIADSISPQNERLITMELVFPRIILSEFNKHRMLSSNTSSCLSGDTLITFDLPTKQNGNKFKSFKMTIKDFCEKWHNGQKKRKRHTYEVNLDNREYTAKEISIITGKSASNIRTICRKGILEVENINKKKSEDFIINGWNYNEYHNGYEIFNPHFRLKNMNIRVLNEDTMVFESSKVSNCFISGKKEVYEVKLENGYKIKCTENHRIFTNEGWKTLKDINIKHNNGITSYDKHSFKVCTNGLNITKEWLEEQRELGKSLTQVCNENKINFKSLSTLSEKFGIYWRKKVLINENLQYKDKQWLQEKLQDGLFSTEIALICNSTSDRIKKQIKKFGLQGNRYVWTSRKEVWNKNKRYKQKEESLVNIKLSAQKRIKKDSWGKYRNLDAKRIRFATEVRNELIEKGQFICAISKSTGNLHLHHIDLVWNNENRIFDKTNLIPLNKEIHRWIHNNNLDIEFLNYYNKGYDLSKFKELYKELSCKCDEINKPKTKGNFIIPRYYNISKITYLGEQETFDIEVKGAHHNFIANGIVVHNSRAIPFEKMVEIVQNDPFIPIAWQKQHKGMQGTEYITDKLHIENSIQLWIMARDKAIDSAKLLHTTGITKQLSNRILEPFMWCTVLITGNKESFDNMFELRCPQYGGIDAKNNEVYFKSKKDAIKHLQKLNVNTINLRENNTLEWLQVNKGQAEIHFMDLAEKMYDVINESVPNQLTSGQWHVPFLSKIDTYELNEYLDEYDIDKSWLEHYTVKVSTALAAKTSYTSIGDEQKINYGKLLNLHDRLLEMQHFSCFENCARVMTEKEYYEFSKGQDGQKSHEHGWCDNLKGFISYRHLLNN